MSGSRSQGPASRGGTDPETGGCGPVHVKLRQSSCDSEQFQTQVAASIDLSTCSDDDLSAN